MRLSALEVSLRKRPNSLYLQNKLSPYLDVRVTPPRTTHYSLFTWDLGSWFLHPAFISQTSFISQQPGTYISHVTCVAGRFHVPFYLFLRRSMLALCSDYSNTALPCLFWLRPPCGPEPLIADGRGIFLQPHHFSPAGPLLPQAEHKCREASEGEASEEEPCVCLIFAVCTCTGLLPAGEGLRHPASQPPSQPSCVLCVLVVFTCCRRRYRL
jgi:hypothetical protein